MNNTDEYVKVINTFLNGLTPLTISTTGKQFCQAISWGEKGTYEPIADALVYHKQYIYN